LSLRVASEDTTLGCGNMPTLVLKLWKLMSNLYLKTNRTLLKVRMNPIVKKTLHLELNDSTRNSI
jgi:hypothetical protein